MTIDWSESGAFHMPALPAELAVDPILSSLLHMACFMELSGEKAVDFDESITAMEHMGYYLQRLNPEQVSEITPQLLRVVEYGKSENWNEEALEFISNLLKNVGIGEE